MPLLNQKSEVAAARAPAWHPSFRKVERLPDIKPVRTNFVVNAAAGTVALALVMFVGWREYQAHLLNAQKALAEIEIAQHQRASNEGLRLTRAFNEDAKKFTEAAAFLGTPVEITGILNVLAGSLPPEVQLESVDFRPADASAPRVLVRGLVAGTKDQASGIASAYVERLRTLPRLAEVFDSVKLNAITPDPKSSALLFEIELRYKQKGAKK